MVDIENEFLRVSINLHGGCLSSVLDLSRSRELLWQGSSDSWTGRDVVIFPFIARLKNKTYTFGGNAYSFDNHGLLRYGDFEVYEKNSDGLTLRFLRTAETDRRYPFDYELFVKYVLREKTLSVNMRVENNGRGSMYFGAGFHPAYKIDCTAGADFDDVSGNEIKFDGTQKLIRYVLDDAGAFIEAEREEAICGIKLSKQLFSEEKTLIYGGVKGAVTLLFRDGGSIEYDLCGAPYLAVWSFEKKGGFVCVEPWWGLPDFADADSEISNKKGIETLDGGNAFECGYKVKFNFGG